MAKPVILAVVGAYPLERVRVALKILIVGGADIQLTVVALRMGRRDPEGIDPFLK